MEDKNIDKNLNIEDMGEDNNHERDRKVAVNIVGEMRKSFLDYSMSVIVARALPDVRDGLKPVHRRILYTLYEEQLLNWIKVNTIPEYDKPCGVKHRTYGGWFIKKGKNC